MLVKLVREGLGRIIVFISWLTRPTPMQRAPAEQAKVDEAAKRLSLYQFYACPFCVKTRRALRRLNLNVELRDAQNDVARRSELEKQGGKIQVPCLRIDEGDEPTWLFESSEIIAYLENRFGPEANASQG